jgi:hypothetical protein
VVHPGPLTAYKRWPLAYWQTLLTWITQQGWQVVLSASPAKQDLQLNQDILSLLNEDTRQHIVDTAGSNLDELRALALSDPDIATKIKTGKCKIEAVDLTNMPNICKQSVFDAIVDYGALDSVLLSSKGKEGMLKCIDHLQDAVRLGNILVCLSSLEKNEFCEPFEERFGWVQELDGDPGEISAWYRGKSNIAASKSNFAKHGLKFYVYTNTDNC